MNARATSSAIHLPITISPELVDFVAAWEGCRLEPYYDGGGVLTCGYGHTGCDIKEGDVWTQEKADEQLNFDLRRRAIGVREYLYRMPSQQQFDALASVSFNCGVHAIGTSGLMARFNAELDRECADRFLLWNMDGGVIVPGLTRRREAERLIYLNGDYSGRP